MSGGDTANVLEQISASNLDLLAVVVCLIATAIAWAKKRFLDKKKVTLVGVMGDGATVAVIFPFMTLVFASYSPNLSVEEVFEANRVLLTIALSLCSLMMLRFVYFPD